VVWEAIFMLVVLKIPVVYLCAVVWWAIRAEPYPPEPAAVTAGLGPPEPECEWRARRARVLRRGPAPRGSSRGGPARRSRVAYAQGRPATGSR
jgi:hypothetical protein